MPKNYQKSIFIFRRDFRIQDNLGLIQALKQSEQVIPIFILTPEQLTKKNTYKSDNSVQFMFESLDELDQQLKKAKSKLFYFYASPANALEKIIKSDLDIEAVFVNQDYTPYSKKRDTELEKVCQKNDLDFISTEDLLLNPVGSITTEENEKIYSKFTPYYNKAKSKKVPNPIPNRAKNYVSSRYSPPDQFKGKLSKFYKSNSDLWRSGGRSNGLKILKTITKHKQYNSKRNCLNYETTNLSAYIKFGCVSIRECYHTFRQKLGTRNDLIKQLYWRDFYHNITYGYPHVIGGPMKEKYKKLKWNKNISQFNKWKQGKTGYPIVDAAMRSMNQTGFMHNRARMIVSSFLIKILLMDWKKGEKYFAQTLYDYDVSNNNGGWQWSASTGADSQPYFRIFNPWLQSEKFDPEATYIKKWLPELKDVPAKHLHQWDDHYDQYQEIDYPAPIVDYKENKKESIKRYKQVA